MTEDRPAQWEMIKYIHANLAYLEPKQLYSLYDKLQHMMGDKK